MRVETNSWIERLQQSPWFSALGDPAADPSTASARSWSEAIGLLEADWDIVVQEAINQFRLAILSANAEAFRAWETIAPPIEDKANELIRRRWSSLPRSENIPAHIPQIMSLYITYGLLEQEYSHVVAPGFFTRLLNMISQGRFPCGWSGQFPHGQLVVY